MCSLMIFLCLHRRLFSILGLIYSVLGWTQDVRGSLPPNDAVAGQPLVRDDAASE